MRAAPANAALNWPPLLEQQANSFLAQFAGYDRSPSKEPRIERMASWLIHFALFYAFCQATSGFIWEQHNKGQQNYQDRKFLHKLSVTLITNVLFIIIFSVNCDDLLHKLKLNFITAQDKIIWESFESLAPLEKHISLNVSDFGLLFFHQVRAIPILFLLFALKKQTHHRRL